MPAKLVSDDGRHVVIRPLAYVAEPDLVRWAAERRFPIIPCNLCGSQDNLQRVRSAMLRDWESEDPGRIENIFGAMANIDAVAPDGPRAVPVHDHPGQRPRQPGGDIAFDEDDVQRWRPAEASIRHRRLG